MTGSPRVSPGSVDKFNHMCGEKGTEATTFGHQLPLGLKGASSGTGHFVR